ncbi:MAG TPA: molybdopterin cofactor-binding domain-containing protein [Candidatus Saccharimonadales bacterium]|nr:molybdopterin cofactor-binding domain-containing protein [Candidatus Saccharimonadales bacterium]
MTLANPTEDLRWVGRSIPRKEGAGKTTGETKFFSDMILPNMLWAKVARSKHPHALIRRIDVSRAESLPGVVAVLTHKDVTGLNGFGIVIPDQPVLCYDKVRFLGDAIAVIAAENEEIAEKAAQLVQVDYEPLPVVTDPVEAMNPEAAKVHAKGNILRHETVRNGNALEAFQNAAVVVEHTYCTPRQMHMFLETEAGIGMLDENGNVVLYVGGQAPYRDQMQVSRALGIKPEKVRVISTPVGGAFGGKEENTVQIHLAMLATKTQRPVKLVWTREESGIAGIKRHPMIITTKTAADREGNLIANQVKIIADTGAYASLGPTVLDVAVENSCGAYKIQNVDIDAYLVYTNNCVSGAFRGFGSVQVNFALESNIDMIAEKLGIDRLEIRKKNVLREGDIGSFGYAIRGSVGVYETLLKVENSELWKNRLKYKTEKTAAWCKRGIGIATGVKGFGFGALPDFAAASIQITPTGKFVIGISCPEIGQGAITAYTQIAAEALHCHIDDIYIASADSKLAPDTGTTSASMALVRGGNAILAAAPKMRQLLLTAASQILEEPLDKLRIERSHVNSLNRKKIATLAQIAQYLEKNGVDTKVIGGFNVPRFEKPAEGSIEIPHWSYMYASGVALVEINTMTGATKVLKFFLATDCGKIINPQSYSGQHEGAILQGIGFALMEDTIIKDGNVLTNNFTTYIIPTIADMPEIQVEPVETYEKIGPFGAKGLGEIGIVAVPAAIANAIYDATGAHIYSLPATPERVYKALQNKDEFHGS